MSLYPDQFWHQNIQDVEDAAEDGDLFGFSLSSSAFREERTGDLAVGVRFEDLSDLGSSLTDAGAVAVIYGSEKNSLFGGLNATITPDQFWTQDYVQILPSQQ